MRKYAVISCDNMNWEFDLNLYDTYKEAYSIMKRDFDRDVAIMLTHDTSFDVNNRKINEETGEDEYDFSGYEDFVDIEKTNTAMHVYELQYGDVVHYEIKEIEV